MSAPTEPAAAARCSTARAGVVLTGIGLIFLVLVGRVAYLQTVGRDNTIKRADRQQHQREVLRARRGSIYDRNGIEMAGTVQTQACFVDPKFMQQVYEEDRKSLVEMDMAVARLAKVLGVSSLLLDGTRVTDRSMLVGSATQLDVLPPFAGG